MDIRIRNAVIFVTNVMPVPMMNGSSLMENMLAVALGDNETLILSIVTDWLLSGRKFI